ncbi:MAG: hypothetical protein LBE01_03135 [Deltaproteobacteria bacterium]|nr:hypothetical protein [Deltaproteobacteria bacterium]
MRDPKKVKVKDPKPVPSNSPQNPSDPDATHSVHKRQGFHAQLMETCAKTKEGSEATPQLITYVNLEPAHNGDAYAVLPVIEGAAESGFKPEDVIAEASYGSDDNAQKANDLGVQVISPAGGKDPEAGKIRRASFKKSEVW